MSQTEQNKTEITAEQTDVEQVASEKTVSEQTTSEKTVSEAASEKAVSEQTVSEQVEPATEKLTNNKDIIAYISELFPNCFTLTGDAKPLKIGVFQELAERLKDDSKVSKTQLRGAIRQYTTSWRYLHCIKEGAERVDLDGNSAGVLDAEHVEHAQKTLAESKAKVQARRKEQAEKKRQEQGEQAKKAAPKRPAKTKSKAPVSNKASAQNGKPTSNKSKPQQATPAKPADTRALTSDEIVVGKEVHVNMGQGNMPATIVEVNKNDVRVRLANGLQMGVKANNLHI